MLLATLPPVEFAIPDLRPAAEAALRASVNEVAAFVRSVVEDLTPSITRNRQDIGIQMHTVLAMALGAEKQGVRLDVTKVMSNIDENRNSIKLASDKLVLTLREAQSAAQRMKVQGASSIGNDVNKISGLLNSLANDLEDYKHSFQEIDGRMKKLSAPIEARDAGKIYIEAIKQVWNSDATMEVETDFMKGGPFIRITIPVESDSMSDIDNILEKEDSVHDFVREKWSAAFGVVAFTYSPVEKV